jgi:hypothetical protein
MPHELPHLDARSQLDALIDVIATMELDSPVSGEAAIAALPPIRRVGNKLFLVEGLNADSGEWETLQTQRYYSAFQAGMQVANRQGPLNDIEFSEFVVKTQAFAEVFSATPEFPDMNEVVAQARELDHFASAHDAQLGFTLASRKAAWSPGYVQQQAASIHPRLATRAGIDLRCPCRHGRRPEPSGLAQCQPEPGCAAGGPIRTSVFALV